VPADLRHPSDGRTSRADVGPGGFPRARKGYDPAAVDRYVAELSAALRAAERREADLRERVADLERRAAVPELDEAAITSALGSETARVLQAAHEAAREVVARAQRRAAELLDEVEASLAARREDVERDAAAQSAAAAAAAAERHAAAEREAAELLESTKAECRAMLEESRALRARVLADLAERRRQLHVQLEQLRAGRDRLAAVIETVGAAVDELRAELAAAEEAAREAAEAAGRRAAEEAAGTAVGGATGAAGTAGAGVVEPPGRAIAAGDQAGGSPAEGQTAGGSPAEGQTAGGSPAEEQTAGGADAAGPPGAGEEAAPALLGPAPGARDESPAPLRAPESADLPSNRVEGAHVAEGWEEGVSILGPAPRPAGGPAGGEDAAQPAANTEGAAAVDELFARIRASRAAEVARAREVLESASRGEGDDEARASLEPRASAEERPGDQAGGEAMEEPSFAQRDELLAPILPLVARALKRALQDDQNELLDALRHAPANADLAAVLPAAVAEPRFAEAVRAGLEQAVAAGRQMAALFDPGGAGRAHERRADARLAAAEAARVARSVVSSLRVRLENGLVGLSADEGGATDVVGAAYREWRGSRAERLAADGVHAAFNAALLASFRGEEGTTARRLRWAVRDEGGGCAECDDNALAGPVPAGEPFPTGESSPPIHPGCRCLLVPVGD